MNKKIFCIFIILLLLACSKTVFADTLSLEIVEGENSYNLLINEENRAFVKKIQNGIRSNVEITIKKEDVQEIVEWFESNNNSKDEIDYSRNRLSFYKNDETNYRGYLLKYCSKNNCKAYQSNNGYYSIESIENGDIGSIISHRIKSTIITTLTIVLFSISLPFVVFFTIFFKLGRKIANSRQKTKHKDPFEV